MTQVIVVGILTALLLWGGSGHSRAWTIQDYKAWYRSVAPLPTFPVHGGSSDHTEGGIGGTIGEAPGGAPDSGTEDPGDGADGAGAGDTSPGDGSEN